VLPRALGIRLGVAAGLAGGVLGSLGPGFGATGFLRINRAVFEAMAPHVETYMHNDGEPTLKAFFKTEIIDGLYWGEDPNFCRKWRALGGKVHALAEAEFGHVGTFEWRGKWPAAAPQLRKAA